ncbi:MAG: PilT/PilU family type 4a pilus ATPase [FCB group bacterium]|jgi:twitching motility protein PilT|nr:PilT/PilU family type 4a pilus ATPase [FCB group bacterium]
MFIGTKTTTNLLEVFRIGLSETVRERGMPDEMTYTTLDCEIQARGADMGRQVDVLRFAFRSKPGTDAEGIQQALQAANIPNAQVQTNNGMAAVILQNVDWRQMQQYTPVDAVIEQFVIRSLRSQSWEVLVKSFKRTDANINRMVEEIKNRKASDLHLRAGSRPYLRIDNDLLPMEDMPVLSATDLEAIVHQLGSQEEVDKLVTDREGSFQFHSAGVGYLRVSGYFKQGAMAVAIRLIPEEPIPFENLGIPEVIANICDAHRGLFLVCGVTGSGKSTTLAAMVDYINKKRHAHVITIEDPIEFVYRDKKSIISQRCVGKDTFSFANGLRGALREDPDVILVGEMRDMETIRAAISAAETGHLVFSTLHTMTSVDTVNRVISYFPSNERELIRQELAYSLKGVVCQRLLKKKGGGRVPCLEILLGGSPLVRDSILEGDIGRLHDILEGDSEMRSFDQYAVDLFKAGTVEKAEALTACSNEEAFERIISGIKSSEGRKLLGR